MPINKKEKFKSINIAIITISDTRTLFNDKSGDLLSKKITNYGHKVVNRKIIKDNVNLIKKTILKLAKDNSIDAIITSGGTGLTGRDSTPEAIKDISNKIIEGFGELFRQISYEKIGTSTIQSRSVAAVIKDTYVFALPGSTNACNDAWEKILKFQLDIRYKPCNFIEIMPRLKEK